MTIRISEDGGRTWPHRRLVWAASSAYSDLALTGDRKVAILYEAGHRDYADEGIAFERIAIGEILTSAGAP